MHTSPFPATHLPGQGFSCSSLAAVLDSASQLLASPEGPLLLANQVDFRARTAALALIRERVTAGASIAADDIYPIVHGGAVIVGTSPDFINDAGAVSPESIRVTPLKVDRRWLADHLVVAVRPDGIRHDVPSLFTDLFRNPKFARQCVEIFSTFARLAAGAIVGRNVRRLAGTINSYREVFDAWLGIALDTKRPFSRFAQSMAASLPPGALGWKPPGAGSCESLLIVAEDRTANQRIVAHLQERGWLATAAALTGGLRVAPTSNGFKISAGHRVDLIGAADLGMDPRVSAPGTCCSLAIAPRVGRHVRHVPAAAAEVVCLA